MLIYYERTVLLTVAGPEIKLSLGKDYNSNLFLSPIEHGCDHDGQFDLATSASEPGQVPRVAEPWVRHWLQPTIDHNLYTKYLETGRLTLTKHLLYYNTIILHKTLFSGYLALTLSCSHLAIYLALIYHALR